MLVLFRHTESLGTYSCAFLQKRTQKFREPLACFVRNAPKLSARHSRVSSGTRLNLRETLPRFFRNAPKNSANYPCVSSGTHPKTPRDTCAFLQERAQKLRETLAFLESTRSKFLRKTSAFCFSVAFNYTKTFITSLLSLK